MNHSPVATPRFSFSKAVCQLPPRATRAHQQQLVVFCSYFQSLSVTSCHFGQRAFASDLDSGLVHDSIPKAQLRGFLALETSMIFSR